MFCGCPNEFGGEPNTKVCPVCLALPGALPVPERRGDRADAARGPRVRRDDSAALEVRPEELLLSGHAEGLSDLAVRHAAHAVGGVVRYWLEDGRRGECRLTRIHLEEDTGKSTHAGSADGRLAGSTSSLVDFNRAGVPLMECVSEPDIRSADEAVAYLETLARTFRQLGVSDVKMEEGSLRCDANVSIRMRGATEYGTKAEIKNMNSFRSVRRAIESEIRRQIEVVESGGRVIQETRGWDEAAGETHSQRSKEEAHDYRYFPDPDLVPMDVTPDDRRAHPRRSAAGAVRAVRALRRRARASTRSARRSSSTTRRSRRGSIAPSTRPAATRSACWRSCSATSRDSRTRAARPLPRQGHAGRARRARRADVVERDQLEGREAGSRDALERAAVRRRQSSSAKASRRSATAARSSRSSTRCLRRIRRSSPTTRPARRT